MSSDAAESGEAPSEPPEMTTPRTRPSRCQRAVQRVAPDAGMHVPAMTPPMFGGSTQTACPTPKRRAHAIEVDRLAAGRRDVDRKQPWGARIVGDAVDDREPAAGVRLQFRVDDRVGVPRVDVQRYGATDGGGGLAHLILRRQRAPRPGVRHVGTRRQRPVVGNELGQLGACLGNVQLSAG